MADSRVDVSPRVVMREEGFLRVSSGLLQISTICGLRGLRDGQQRTVRNQRGTQRIATVNIFPYAHYLVARLSEATDDCHTGVHPGQHRLFCPPPKSPITNGATHEN